MHERRDALWIEQCEMSVDGKVSSYLQKYPTEYQKLREEQMDVARKNPKLLEVFGGTGEITLTVEEHKALKDYLQLADSAERYEREYHFYFGQPQVFSYGQMLAQIKRSFPHQ